MNKTKKTGIFCLIIGITLVFAFTACDSLSDNGNDNINGNENENGNDNGDTETHTITFSLPDGSGLTMDHPNVLFWINAFNNIPDAWKRHINEVQFGDQQYFESIGLATATGVAYSSTRRVVIKITDNILTLGSNYLGLLYHEVTHILDRGDYYSGENSVYTVNEQNFWQIWWNVLTSTERLQVHHTEEQIREGFANLVTSVKLAILDGTVGNERTFVPSSARSYLIRFIEDIEAGRTGTYDGFWAPDIDAEIVNNIPYIDENGVAQTADNVTIIDNSNAAQYGLRGWYLLRGNWERNTTLTVSGTAYIILENGCDLTVMGSNNNAGLNVSGDNSLTIYIQSTGDGMGKLTATGSENGAGIGGGNNGTGGTITINGGTIIATSGLSGAGIGGGHRGASGTITINGGTLTATSSRSSAGIGSGRDGTSGGIITINGGTILANGGQYGAGIGGGAGVAGGIININDGLITANGGAGGAGIGGGNNSAGGIITIVGGTITATGGDNSAGIGGSGNGNGGIITISGGTVYATGKNSAAGIGGGRTGADGTLTITGGNVTSNGSVLW